jgi:hypothetical protein
MLILVDSISRVAAAKAWSMGFCTDRFLGCSEVGMGEHEISQKKGRKLPFRTGMRQ